MHVAAPINKPARAQFREVNWYRCFCDCFHFESIKSFIRRRDSLENLFFFGYKFIDMMMYGSNGSCQDCWDLGPPPDTILTIPPPPMPTFFASSFITVGNRSNAPCPLLCDWTTGQGLEMNEEFPFKGNSEENSWFLLTVSSFTVILLLGMLLTLFLLKFRQNQKMKTCLHKTTYNDRTYESILYPTMKDNHVLWATLTPKGKPQAVAVSSVPPPLPPRVSQVRSFENCAFADMDDYPMKYGRPRVSSPMRIENPNIPPLNFYPSFKRNNYPSLL